MLWAFGDIDLDGVLDQEGVRHSPSEVMNRRRAADVPVESGFISVSVSW